MTVCKQRKRPCVVLQAAPRQECLPYARRASSGEPALGEA